MLKNAVPYRGTHLIPGSRAHHLWESGLLKELDQHLKELDINKRKLEGKETHEQVRR